MRKSVERWRSFVNEELSKAGYPLPAELILALIHRESRGAVGSVNPKSGASGLMQVMPIALKDYNQNNTPKYTMDDLRAKTDSAARIQIRIGLWIMARFVKGAFKYLKGKLGDVALDDLIKTAHFFYTSGPRRAREKLDLVMRPTFEEVKKRFPKWDRIAPAQGLWDFVGDEGGQWDIPAVDRWLESNILIEHKKTVSGAVIGLIALALFWQYFGGKDQ